MPKGRKHGCPVNIKNWLVYAKELTSTTWTRVYGLTKLTHTVESETEDGSADTDVWSEPYVTKRSGKASLEGKPVVVESTGIVDAGQALLTEYAQMAGCDGDLDLKFIDPYGHAWIGEYIVTNHEVSSDNSGDTESWDIELVGDIEPQPYVNILTVTAMNGSTAISASGTITVTMGTPAIITVGFTPEGVSNTRFRVSNSARSVCQITNITETGFTIQPISVGTSTITITSVEGAKTFTFTASVAAAT